MNKTLKILTGDLGFEVVKGNGPSSRQLPDIVKNDRSYYHHPVVRVNEEDLERWKKLRGGPLMFEHGQGQTNKIVLGKIVDSVITNKNTVFITASIFDTEEGRWAAKKIDDGDIASFSISYDFDHDNYGKLQRKNFNEVSLVVKPFFKGANISVCASDSQTYNNDSIKNSNKIEFPVKQMEEQQQQQQKQEPVGTSSNVEKISSRALELELEKERKERDDEKKRTEAELQEKELMKKELESLRAEKNARLLEQGNKKVEELNQALLKTKKALNLEKLPDGYEESMQNIARNSVLIDSNNPMQKTAEVTASVTTMFGNKIFEMSNENEILKKQLEEMKKKHADTEKELTYHANRINASKNNNLNTTSVTSNPILQENESKKVDVSASGANDIMSIFITVPTVKSGTMEAKAYQQHNPAFDSIHIHGVNASGANESQDNFVQFEKVPDHNMSHMCQNSIRYRKDKSGFPVGEAWMRILVDGYKNADGMTTLDGFKVTKDITKER
jgi:hypothetical protein